MTSRFSRSTESGDESPHSKSAGWIVAITACTLLVICGCGRPAKPTPPTVTLAGTVKVDGMAVEQGRIRFSPTTAEQGAAAEGLIAAGQYTVDKAPVGSVVVTFTGTKKTGRMVELYGQKSEESVNVIPVKYSRGLPVTVESSGDSNHNFNLTSK